MRPHYAFRFLLNVLLFDLFTCNIASPATDVDAWERREGKEKPDGTFRKPYYSKSRNDLSSIGSLDSFVMQPIREEVSELVWK